LVQNSLPHLRPAPRPIAEVVQMIPQCFDVPWRMDQSSDFVRAYRSSHRRDQWNYAATLRLIGDQSASFLERRQQKDV
jgi:hypothetical protein